MKQVNTSNLIQQILTKFNSVLRCLQTLSILNQNIYQTNPLKSTKIINHTKYQYPVLIQLNNSEIQLLQVSNILKEMKLEKLIITL